MSKTLKTLLILIGLYAASVALFESMLGYFQPENQATLVVTTFDTADVGADRVLARIEHEGELFVAVNHWPRQWYGRLLDNDQVWVRFEGIDGRYTASKVPESEKTGLNAARPLGLGFRILTGFPPRYFVRLTPNA
ncbi:MAG: hypothetical protein QNL18_02400 [Pseudomonadales bacterium]|jgi:hypothetical protein|tara:strand:- start:61 stop:468 length:408 start_codon:yes stop_codon:yes gene_type:complete